MSTMSAELLERLGAAVKDSRVPSEYIPALMEAMRLLRHATPEPVAPVTRERIAFIAWCSFYVHDPSPDRFDIWRSSYRMSQNEPWFLIADALLKAFPALAAPTLQADTCPPRQPSTESSRDGIGGELASLPPVEPSPPKDPA